MNYMNATEVDKHFNATYALLSTAVASDPFARSAIVPFRNSSSMAANFICLAHVSHADCLACLADIFATAYGRCRVKFKGFFFTDACYLFYAIGDVSYCGNSISEFSLCEMGKYCDSVWEEGEVAAQLTELSQEVIRGKGRFVVAKKKVTLTSRCGGRKGVAYAALQCTRAGAYPLSHCQGCLQSAIKKTQGCWPGGGAVVAGLGCFLMYSHHAFFDESLVASNTGDHTGEYVLTRRHSDLIWLNLTRVFLAEWILCL